MLYRIDILRDIARRCEAGQPLDEGQSKWLGDALRKFLDHDCASLMEAFGLHAPRGGVPWWREEAIRKRDRALRKLARRFCADLSAAASAKRVHSLAQRYAASAWRHDRDRPAMPRHYRNTPHEYLWRAFKSGAAMPLGDRTLRGVLAEARGRAARVLRPSNDRDGLGEALFVHCLSRD